MIDIPGFGGVEGEHVVSIANAPFCLCSYVPIKLYVQKTG